VTKLLYVLKNLLAHRTILFQWIMVVKRNIMW